MRLKLTKVLLNGPSLLLLGLWTYLAMIVLLLHSLWIVAQLLWFLYDTLFQSPNLKIPGSKYQVYEVNLVYQNWAQYKLQHISHQHLFLIPERQFRLHRRQRL